MPRSVRCASSAQPSLLHRDVFIVDGSIGAASFIDSYNRYGKHHFKHPTDSKHVAARYAHYIYKKSNYNFNSVSEYLLHLCAATHFIKQGNEEPTTHSVHIFPDNITLSNIPNKSTDDIEAICRLLLTDRICSWDIMEGSLSANYTVLDNNNDSGVVVVAPSENSSMDTAVKTLEALRSRPERLMLSADFTCHRQGCNLLSLPREEAYTSAVLQTAKSLPFYTGYL